MANFTVVNDKDFLLHWDFPSTGPQVTGFQVTINNMDLGKTEMRNITDPSIRSLNLKGLIVGMYNITMKAYDATAYSPNSSIITVLVTAGAIVPPVIVDQIPAPTNLRITQ